MKMKHSPAKPSAATLKAMAARRRPRPKPLSPKVKKLIGQMPLRIGADFTRSLTMKWRGKGYSDPKRRRDATVELQAKAIRDACIACADGGVVLHDFTSLSEAPAMDALLKRVDSGRWSGRSLGSVMAKIRTVHRVLHGQTPSLLRVRTTYWLRQRTTRLRPSRSVEQYVRGAVAIAAFADIVQSSGLPAKAQAMRHDAALLAGAATLNGRRGEYAMTDMKLSAFRLVNGASILDIYWDESQRKNKKTRSVRIQDQRAVDLIRRVIGDRTEGPVFAKIDGSPSSGEAIYASLRRATLLALGVSAGPNALRDAGTKETTDPVEMGRKIGSSPKVALAEYRGSIATAGERLIASAFEEWASSR